MKQLILIFATVFFLFSCGGEQPEVASPKYTASVTFMFESQVDGLPLLYDGTKYKNSNDQEYSVNGWKYFISNVSFYNNNKLIFIEKDSYHFIDDEENSTSFDVLAVPSGRYDEIRYSYGVDEEHNYGDSTNGDIDPGTGQFWAMGGYRFSSFDGVYGSKFLAFHVGGNTNYSVHSFKLQVDAVVKDQKNTLVHSIVNINKMFDSPNKIDFITQNNLADELTTIPVAQNIANGMFMIHHIENPK